MQEVWFKLGDLRQKVGQIVDRFANYFEIYCPDDKQYYIVKIENVTFID